MKRSGIDKMICEQESAGSLSREIIESIQLKKLNGLLLREKLQGRYYSNLPAEVKSLEELSTFPFTTDEDLAANAPGMLLVSQAYVQRVLSDATSGTTGSAKRVFYTEKDCENTIRLFEAGIGEFVSEGNSTMICMPFSGAFGLGELIAEAVRRLGARPIKTGTGKTYGEIQKVLENEKPDTFIGMPAHLLGILRLFGKCGLERALVSGDACPDTVLSECEKLLGTRLYPHYGSREMGLGGAICCSAHEGMHLRENHVIAEIIDGNGRVLPYGEYGELVITTIGMEALPLIRYRTGDYTRILPFDCPCGSSVLRLDTIHREKTADIEKTDNIVFSFPGVIDYMAESSGEGLKLKILSDGTLNAQDIMKLPGVADVEVKTACQEDRPFYPGKRTII